MLRLSHFSDVHLSAGAWHLQRADWFNKRLTGWLNLRLGRGRRFRHAETVLAALVADLQQRRPDHVIFSGDATTLGLESELARAAEILGLGRTDCLPGLAVPGNHDYYVCQAAASGSFERYFGPWQAGERVDGQPYPFAQRVGPAWLVAVNSCTGNVWPWDASGSVGRAQLQRLEQLLDRLAGGPRILVTHYPLGIASGAPEPWSRALRDLAELIGVVTHHGISLWLHGHRHEPYCLRRHALVPFPVICAGSATQDGYSTYAEYTLDGKRLQVVRRVFQAVDGAFHDGETFVLELPG